MRYLAHFTSKTIFMDSRMFIHYFVWTLCCDFMNTKLILPEIITEDRAVCQIVADIIKEYFKDAHQVVIWGTQTFLQNDVPAIRLLNVPYNNIQNYNQLIDGAFIFVDSDIGFLLNIPLRWKHAKFVLVVPPEWTEQNISYTFTMLWQVEVVNVIVILPYMTAVQIFTYIPYHSGDNSAGSPVPAGSCLFSPIKLTNLHHSKLNLTMLDLAPDVIYKKKNKSRYQDRRDNYTVKGDHLEGVEVELIKTLAQKMNFDPQYSFPTDGSHWGWLMENGTISGMVADVYHGKSDIGFGHVTPNLQVTHLLEYSRTISVDCYGWGIPLGTGHKAPAWTMLTSEFSALTWGLLFLAFCVSSAVLWGLSRIHAGDMHVFLTPPSVFCYTCNTLIATPVVLHAKSTPVRTFVALWLLYAIVISAAYQAELGSIVTVPWAPPNIRNFEELLESDLELRTPWRVYSQIRTETQDALNQRLLKRFVPVSRVKKNIYQLQQLQRDFAYFMNSKSLNFFASQSNWNFHVLTEDCMMIHHTSLVLRMGSPLIPRINQLIQWLSETGFFVKWEHDFTARSRSTENPRAGLSLPHLLGAFMLLALGLLLSSLVLLLEVLLFRLQSNKFKMKKHFDLEGMY